MFLTIGILIAVFGMRLVFPILIVSMAADIGMTDVVRMALEQPNEYAAQADRPPCRSLGIWWHVSACWCS